MTGGEMTTDTLEGVEEQAKLLQKEMDSVRDDFSSFFKDMAESMTKALIQGKSLESVMSKMVLSLSQSLLNSATKGLLGQLSTFFPSAGNHSGGVKAFARGGVVNQPTGFSLPGGVGIMGEAGSEAIMPLARASDGRLGVRAGGGQATHITVNISTPNVDSFQKSEDQVSRMLARAVAKGQRKL